METDAQLLARWGAGDETAGNELLQRHVDPLLRFFYSKASAHTEDLVQVTLLACLESRSRFRGEGSFRSFLFGIARNVLLRHYRTSSKHKVDPLMSSVHDLATTPSGAVARDERHALLRAALPRIPLDFQIALELHYFEGLTPQEVADVLGVDPTTTRTRLFRGRARLRQVLEQLEASPEARRAALEPVGGDQAE